MNHALRIIDANANRAREALRVMEDAARFILDDESLCAALKQARHELADALREIGADNALAWRDTQGDAGAAVTATGEYQRAGVRAVVVAAGKRLSEALRSIEEYAKTIEPPDDHDTGEFVIVCGDDGCAPGGHAVGGARAFESLRYRCYDLERDLVLALGAASRPRWRLCVILTEALCTHHPWLEVARRAVRAGADCLQLREKSLDSRELLERARALVAVAHESATTCAVIINDRPDIALLSRADGVHLGQSDMSVRDARRILGTDALIGVSTERIEQARAALSDGADYLGVGPMFPTTTKDKPRLAGPAYLREVLTHTPELPHALAIGGVTPERMNDLRAAAGVPPGNRWGVAVSSAVCAASDPGAACAAFLTPAQP